MQASRVETVITLKDLSDRVIQAIPWDRLGVESFSVKFNLSSGQSFVGKVDSQIQNVEVPAGVDVLWYRNVESVEYVAE